MAMNSNYDPLQLFFHSENELQDVLPSKEFWKKFELLPSPSPNLAYDQSIIHSSQPFLKPIIFQDCMWSGFNVDAELEKADATWMESAGLRALNMDYLQDLNMSLLQCIDPALIFPYPVEEKSKHSAPPKEDGDDDNNDDGEVKHSDRSLFVLKRCHIFTPEHNYAACLSCEQAEAGCVATADCQMYNSSCD